MRCGGLLILLCSSAADGFSLSLSAGGRSFTASEPPVLIDLRPRSAFEESHIAGSCSLPVGSLLDLMFELPPPGEWPLALVGDADALAEARELLGPKGWRAAELDSAEPATWAGRPLASGAPTALSWRPNSFLAAVLRELELPADGAAIDVGCGSGRDAVAMAQRLPGWDVLGLDNHEAALERGRALARGCGADVAFHKVEIRKAGPAGLAALAAKPLRLVHGCRFLDRRLLEGLPELLAPGGIVVYSHFEDPLDGPPPAPPFRRGRRLERGELRTMLGEEQGFEVLCDVSGEMVTRGVWTPASFYAARFRGHEPV